MLPLFRVRDKSGGVSVRYSRTTRRCIYAVAASLLCGILLVAHWSAPPEWKEATMERIRQGPFWPVDQTERALWDQRAQDVRKAFKDAYAQYRQHGYPADEVFPISNNPRNNFNGWGVTLVDSIDTMILMDLKPEYEHAKLHVATIDFTHGADTYVPFFEAIIRYLGGLLSAYSLTKEPLFLTKAEDVGRALLPIFNTTSGLPAFSVDPITKNIKTTPWNGGLTLLSEMASCQLEYKYLAHLTGKEEYYTAVDHIVDVLQKEQLSTGMWYTFWNSTSGKQANSQLSVGAMSDSAYEYLLKGYLMSGRSEKRLLDMYLKSARGAIEKLVFLSRTRNMMYVTDVDSGGPSGKMEHLSCFFPGLLALGNHFIPASAYSSPEEKDLFDYAAEGLAHTCWALYADSATGVGPDEVSFEEYDNGNWENGRWVTHLKKWYQNGSPAGKVPGVSKLALPLRGIPGSKKDYQYRTPAYMLRPETIETVYIMYKTTKNPIWRDRGWEMFDAIRKNARAPGGGFASMDHVDTKMVYLRDDMPSFFFAETLKYFYLLFSNEDTWPLDKIVFNTEAHPLPVFDWTFEEVKSFGVKQT